jgi:hypothetical protein
MLTPVTLPAAQKSSRCGTVRKEIQPRAVKSIRAGRSLATRSHRSTPRQKFFSFSDRRFRLRLHLLRRISEGHCKQISIPAHALPPEFETGNGNPASNRRRRQFFDRNTFSVDTAAGNHVEITDFVHFAQVWIFNPAS